MLPTMVSGFSPTNSIVRSNSRTSTIVMDGKTRDLRDRMRSVKNTRRITEAMRLVAAARVRRAQEAVIKSRPIVAQMQMVYILNMLSITIIDTVHFICVRIFYYLFSDLQIYSRRLQSRGVRIAYSSSS